MRFTGTSSERVSAYMHLRSIRRKNGYEKFDEQDRKPRSARAHSWLQSKSLWACRRAPESADLVILKPNAAAEYPRALRWPSDRARSDSALHELELLLRGRFFDSTSRKAALTSTLLL